MSAIKTDLEIGYANRYLRGRYSQFPILEWPFPPATDQVSDPHLIIPPKVDVLVGEAFEIMKYCVSRRDGTTIKAATSSGPAILDLNDRWQVTPTSVGTFNITITEAGQQGTMLVNVVAPLGAGAGTRNICCIGDSITEAGVFVQLLKEDPDLGSHINLVGTKTVSLPPRSHHQEGQSGQSFGWFYNNVADSGAPPRNSPFAPAGTINMPGWVTALAGVGDAPPTHAVWLLSTNTAYLNNAAGVEAAINLAYPKGAALMAAMSVTIPSIKHLIVTAYTGRAGQAAWQAFTLRDHYDWRQCQVRCVERMLTDFGGQEVSNKRFLVPGHLSVDPTGGYLAGDPLHPNYPTGHVQVFRRLRAALTANW